MDLREELFKNQDLKYRDFHTRLVPNTPPEQIIGVRMPVLRTLARTVYKENVQNLCEYHEERMIKSMTIGMRKCSVDEHIEDIKAFVPLIENWAICDSGSSSFKFVKKDLDAYYPLVMSYNTGAEYPTRFCVVMLMDYYINDEYIDRVLDTLVSIKSDYYYINMAVAWAISVAFVKYQDKTMKILESRILSKDVQNKAIQKIRDSYRVDKDTKDFIKQYKL